MSLLTRLDDCSYDKLLKTELEVALDDHLRTNKTRLQNDPLTSGFYKHQRRESPVKRESAATTAVDEVKKPKQRRPTLKAREDLEQQYALPFLNTESRLQS